jgi:DNA-binding response OmpR family regulator
MDKNTPIIFLTAKNLREDILRGYQIGADDYITKPFDTELLLYKIKAILQRSSASEVEDQEQFKISAILFDSVLRQLKIGNNEYKLSPKENELLKLLCMHRNDFMPRDLALRKIWKKENYFTARSMDVYIAKLRKYLKDDENLEIINVHGEGFRLLVKN